MPKMPGLSGRDVVKILQQFGWAIAPAITQGTLRGLIGSAGLSVEEFIEAARRI